MMFGKQPFLFCLCFAFLVKPVCSDSVQVIRYTNKVYRISEDNSRKRIYLDYILQKDNKVITLAGSSADLKVDSYLIIRMMPQSILSINEASDEPNIRFQKGRFFFLFYGENESLYTFYIRGVKITLENQYKGFISVEKRRNQIGNLSDKAFSLKAISQHFLCPPNTLNHFARNGLSLIFEKTEFLDQKNSFYRLAQDLAIDIEAEYGLVSIKN